MNGNRRLDTNVKLNDEAAKHYAQARGYERVRQNAITAAASKAYIGLSVLEAQGIYDRANGISQGVFEAFQQAVDREIQEIVTKEPARVRYSAFADWINDEMNDIEKARREIVAWLDNPKLAAFDTETTGWFDEGHVPVTAAASTLEGISLCDITMRALDNKGGCINITEGASKANHLTDAMIAEYLPLEQNEIALISLEGLVQDGRIFVGYNTKFDRDMICRAFNFAMQRTGPSDAPDNNIYRRLNTLLNYFKQPSHWLEAKDIFTRAIGLEPYPGPGKYTRLEDVARATKALTSEESQEHGALADCQLIAKIVQNIRKELEEMPGKKPAPVAKQTEEIQTEPETTGSDWPESAKEYTAQLETSLNELQAQNETLSGELADRLNEATARIAQIDKLIAENKRLTELCEQYQQSDATQTKHYPEARLITWSDFEINDFRFNVTVRDDISEEEVIAGVMRHIRICQALRDNEKVKKFRVGLKDYWKDLKGFDKPTNGKPAATDEQPADEKPATPKGNQPPAANKPNTPPPANKPAQPAAPQGNQPPTGKVQGAKASQLYTGLIRHQIDGLNTYDLTFVLNNGKPADKPIPVSKRDTAALEKALANVGWTPDSFELGTPYDVKILNEWVWGQPTNKEKPDGPRYHDNATFTVQTETANEEMPF